MSFHSSFVGKYERSLSRDFRITLPRHFLARLGEEFYLLEPPGVRVLRLAPRAAFEAFVADLHDAMDAMIEEDETEEFPQEDWDLARTASLTQVDATGRLYIPTRVRTRAMLHAPCACFLIGALDCVEIWQRSFYEQVHHHGSRDRA